MLTRLYVAAISWGVMNKGSIVVAVLKRFWSFRTAL